MSRRTESSSRIKSLSALRGGLALVFCCAVLPALPAQSSANAANLYKLGVAALDQERPFQAIEYFKDALRVNPNYFDPIISLANAYYYLDEYDEALRYVQQ